MRKGFLVLFVFSAKSCKFKEYKSGIWNLEFEIVYD
jgi:hypothetical protein